MKGQAPSKETMPDRDVAGNASSAEQGKPPNGDKRKAQSGAPGELLTGEGDPGLTLTGGSGHA
jgi:hypothetical protein